MTPVVVIRPLSGYINRLQAIISAQLLAGDLGADLWVDWQASEVAPVRIDAVLDSEFCERHSKSTEEIVAATGVDPARIPSYLHTDAEKGVITLAGFDQGEQVFMPSLKQAWATGEFSKVVISAGGKFTIHGSEHLTESQQHEFRRRRHQAYADLRLHPGIEEAAHETMVSQTSFIALHLRYSDRSLQSPWSRQIRPALHQLRQSSGVTKLFIAADTPSARQEWMQRARSMGLQPWSTTPPDVPRSDPRSAWGALVDWRILTRSAGIVYFAASSFAEEAAVASGHFDVSIGLRAGRTRRAWMSSRQWAVAVLIYPQRHGWLSR